MTTQRVSRHRRLGCGVTVAGALVAVAAACGPVAAAAPFSSGQITHDANDTFTIANQTGNAHSITPSNPGTASVTGATTNTGDGSRFVFFDSTQGTSRDQQSCATIASETDWIDQEGLALRITTGPGGTGRAVVFAKNVYLGVTAAFNVYGMDGANTSAPFVEFGSHDYRNLESSGVQIHLPFALCARVVGNVFTGKVWHPNQTAEPAWNDPNYAFSLTLPAAWVGTGSAGYYFGHVRANDTIAYTNMRSLPSTF